MKKNKDNNSLEKITTDNEDWQQLLEEIEAIKKPQKPKTQQGKATDEVKRNALIGLFILVALFIVAWVTGLLDTAKKYTRRIKGHSKKEFSKMLGIEKETLGKIIRLLYPKMMGNQATFKKARILPEATIEKMVRSFRGNSPPDTPIGSLIVSKSWIGERCGTTSHSLLEDMDLHFEKHRTYKEIGIHPTTYRKLDKLPLAYANKIIAWHEKLMNG